MKRTLALVDGNGNAPGLARQQQRSAGELVPRNRRQPPLIVERDMRNVLRAPLQAGPFTLPAEIVWQVVGYVVRDDRHVHARLRTLMSLGSVCQALHAARLCAMHEPAFLDFRQAARAWDAKLIVYMYPGFEGKEKLLAARYGLASASEASAGEGAQLEPESIGFQKRMRYDQASDARTRVRIAALDFMPGHVAMTLCRVVHLDVFDKFNLGGLKRLALEDGDQDLLPSLLERLGSAKLPALHTLNIGREVDSQQLQSLLDKCPALTTLDTCSLPAVLPASLEHLTVARFDSSGIDAQAWAHQGSAMRSLSISRLRTDPQALLKQLAPTLVAVHIADIHASLGKTLRDLQGAALRDLVLPMLPYGSTNYEDLGWLPEAFPRLESLVLQIRLPNAQSGEALAACLTRLASMPGLHLFSLKLAGTPLGLAGQSAIAAGLLTALHANPDLCRVSVTLPGGSALHDPQIDWAELENRCYAPRERQTGQR